MIFGDSFAAPTDFPESWVNGLGQCYVVDNRAQAGASEYRIWQQIRSADLELYDLALCVHTSDQRLFVPHNPLHQQSRTHQHCDVIFTDIEYRDDEFSRACQEYFRWIHDWDYHRNIHNLICQQIDQEFDIPVLHTTHFDYENLYAFAGMVSFHDLWQQHRGSINHYTQHGNRLVLSRVLSLLESL